MSRKYLNTIRFDRATHASFSNILYVNINIKINNFIYIYI